MKAFVSLHTAKPATQSDSELSYEGYARQMIEYIEGFADKPVDVLFPEILETMPGEITHICIGSEEAGNGTVHLVVHSMPYIKLEKGLAPRIIITNIAHDGLPVKLHPIARTAIKLFLANELKAEDIHPKLFEAINEELSRLGAPIMTVTRAGTAKMVGKINNIASISEWGNA